MSETLGTYVRLYCLIFLSLFLSLSQDSENAFQINHADKSFHVYAQSKADKSNWISNLTKQINRLKNGMYDQIFSLFITV